MNARDCLVPLQLDDGPGGLDLAFAGFHQASQPDCGPIRLSALRRP